MAFKHQNNWRFNHQNLFLKLTPGDGVKSSETRTNINFSTLFEMLLNWILGLYATFWTKTFKIEQIIILLMYTLTFWASSCKGLFLFWAYFM